MLALRYYEGLSDAEIAEVVGCKPGTVRGYASRALARLRVELETKSQPGSRVHRNDMRIEGAVK
ncbi:hypothetical protein GCM10029978_119000 [Actinoallomurus acanthiterrae]